jgi:uncharacterized membrane protein YhiD involved in acid resistance
MHTQFFETLPYIAGGATTVIAAVGSTDVTFWLQAGMAGIVVLLLLKVFPFLMDHLEEKDKRHDETILDIVERNERKDAAWQEIVQSRGICPIKEDNHNDQ